LKFDKVPPGAPLDIEISLKDDRDGNQALSHGFSVSVKPGETKEAILGGTGRRLLGRSSFLGATEDVDWKRDVHRLLCYSRMTLRLQMCARGFLQESIAVLTGLTPPLLP